MQPWLNLALKNKGHIIGRTDAEAEIVLSVRILSDFGKHFGNLLKS